MYTFEKEKRMDFGMLSLPVKVPIGSMYVWYIYGNVSLDM